MLAQDRVRAEAQRPHFEAKAKNVIVIFCSGALSQVDTFDYKPELIRLDGKPLPGNEKLVSFQGPNGNLTRPLWKFRPRGRVWQDGVRPAYRILATWRMTSVSFIR